ncbi:hypothetical protein HNR57_000490 [Streptomyces paradoxus]|uniref:Uncharacterized protein n=1 Tax=Streptomyces paradoxus TaxID=66375 RepID=A0A7W9T6Q8_9ACTN|nr:hypothetical protein [Streptomyces paradoxus]
MHDGGSARGPRIGQPSANTTYHGVRGRHEGDRASGRDTGTPAEHHREHRGKPHFGVGTAERDPGRYRTARPLTALTDATSGRAASVFGVHRQGQRG